MSVFNKLLKPIKRQLRQMISRGVVTGVDESKKWRELQIIALDDETLDKIEHAEPYGFSSSPIDDAETILLSSGGRRAHTIAICVGDRRYRLAGMARGEVALYDDQGQYIHIKRAGIEISGTKVDIIGDVTVTGKITASDDITSTGGDVKDKTRSMQEMVTEHNVHVHVDSVGGTTAPPTVPMT